jgi:hypothetical protein
MRAGAPITCPEMPSTLRSRTSSLERRDSIKTTGCGQLLSVLKYAVLGESMYYAPQTIAVSERVPRAWGKQPPPQWRHRYAVP